MRPDVGFDACYRSNRGALLHETFLLTGDVRAATTAVRDAFVISWQHWDRVGRQDDPMEYVRPLAWRKALRRHRGRIWHRNRGISEEDKATLDALHKLPQTSRRLLLALEVADLPMDQAALQSHLSTEAALLQAEEARTQVATALQIAPEMVGDRFRGITYASSLTGNLPRPSIVMRAGSKRRRVRAATLVVSALSLVLAAGAVVADPHRTRPGADPAFLPTSPTTSATPPDDAVLKQSQLIDVALINATVPDPTWTVTRTDSNSAGDGLNSICQTTRYADPLGLGALVRVFSTKADKLTAVETLATSRSTRRAAATYRVTMGWFGRCKAPRLQLVKAFDVSGVGEHATLIYLNQYLEHTSTQAIAIAQVGTQTVSLVFTSSPKRAPGPDQLANALAEATAGFCDTDCIHAAPTYTPQLPHADAPRRLLAAVDLPPVGNIQSVWVGTKPQARLESGATAECKTPGLVSSGASPVQGRTFLMPQAALPATFGAEETVGGFTSPSQAKSFAASFATALVKCASKDFTVQLTSYGTKHVGTSTYQTWLVKSRVNRKVTLEVRVGLVRMIGTVAVVVFTPASGADMGSDAFANLTRRAALRL